MGDDGALLDELAALLGDDCDVPLVDETAPLTTNSVSLFVPFTPRRPSGSKEELTALRAEAAYLSAQLEQLRKSRSSVAVHALEERRRRRRAEAECEALREAVYRHTQFARGLRSLVSPSFPLTIDLCRFLHRPTRLPRDRRIRWGEYDRHSQDKRILAAVDMLCRETQAVAISSALSTADPFVQCDLIDERSSHSVTSTTVYAIDTNDIAAVARAACVATRDIVAVCPYGHPLCVSRDIVDTDASPSSNTLYRVMGVQHSCPHSGEDLVVESHLITTYRIASDQAVILWDYVDEDELHPTPEATNVTREITGACLIRRERCADGVERTVFRSMSTKKFRFHDPSAIRRLDKFVCVAQPVPMVRIDELLFREIVLQQLAAERDVLARGLQQGAV